ncbi:MAG: ABC transporter permease [Candidatus Acetothermia bacterium]|jgi:ABC-2 type transport system permease protein|nr:ABC transporter permease [Candidatus Acetothermia bacterium]MDH7505671.1 ABC transporter permease [Candidatus Acetothermia bacterium]
MRGRGLVFIKQVWVNLKLHFRDRMAVFWEFVFPLVLMFLFVLALGGEQGGVSLKVGLVDLDGSELSKALVAAFRETPVLQLEEGAEESLRAELEAGRLDGLVIIPQGLQASLGRGGSRIKLLLYGGMNPQFKGLIPAVVQQLLVEFNERIQPAPLGLVQETVAPSAKPTEEISYVDFALPSYLAMAVLATALLSGAIDLAFERKWKLLKLLGTMPLHPVTFFSARTVQQFIVTVLQGIVVVGLAITLLGAKLQGGYLALALLFTVGSLSFILMGFAIAAFSKTHEAAIGLAQIFYMPMVLLSGAFFPPGLMPAWLQPIMRVLPLRFFLDGFREITIRGAGLAEIGPNLGVLAGWGLICLLITFRFFKWATEA